jgi:hypothetical protein
MGAVPKDPWKNPAFLVVKYEIILYFIFYTLFLFFIFYFQLGFTLSPMNYPVPFTLYPMTALHMAWFLLFYFCFYFQIGLTLPPASLEIHHLLTWIWGATFSRPTEWMTSRSVSTNNRTLRCVKQFSCTGISMFIIIMFCILSSMGLFMCVSVAVTCCVKAVYIFFFFNRWLTLSPPTLEIHHQLQAVEALHIP